jgi:phosphoglycerol transferase MdoB-like AlkP superfamily enzyme
LASFPPLPGDSIVKRHLSQNVFTIARLLKDQRYETLFLYGGRGVFDGMRSFAINNGYDRFIERKDFPNPTFTTIWGVADEDLMNKTIEELRLLDAQKKPFFATLLTVSNHKPYTYPKGRISEDPEEHRRTYAVKYTDWAIGDFIRKAKKEPFYKNTLFAVVADHGARIYGSQTLPIDSYKIPLLVVGAQVPTPKRISILGSQLDVSPTLLGLMGISYESVFFGRNLLSMAGDESWVVLNHNRDIGFLQKGRLVALGLNKTVDFFDVTNTSVKRSSAALPSDVDTAKNAMALFQVADDLYMNQRYRVLNSSVPARAQWSPAD